MDDSNNYTFINGIATVQVATGAGTLVRIVLTETAAGAISISDNTAGTTQDIGIMKASIAENSYPYGVKFTKGLRIGTAGASKLTVVWSQP